ncbi:hypothetical protein [Caballeronia sp. ATUFL_M2_KS44]|uniref:hypothetical protein n=1 Tax=Caballeronia sp. ATUFL_M2_KS44 TaxID=2921767 RepID=UPI002029891D|nr:hypothetical protein [Caballeronia sp. ATUFL_M2_KS44]
MDIFFAKSRRGISHYLSAKSGFSNARLWINGGVDLTGFDLSADTVSVFNIEFDLSDEKQFQAAVGTIKEHYDECIVWVEA